MEQRGFIEAALSEVFQNQRAGGERGRYTSAVERASGQTMPSTV